jgi:hypothetical protein
MLARHILFGILQKYYSEKRNLVYLRHTDLRAWWVSEMFVLCHIQSTALGVFCLSLVCFTERDN